MRRKNHILQRIQRTARTVRLSYLRWQMKYLPEGLVLILVALTLGVLTGCAAGMLKRLIKLLNNVIVGNADFLTPDMRLLIFPISGIFLTSIYQRYVVGANISQGTKIIRNDLNSKRTLFSPLRIFNSIIGCSLTMGLGASGGSEGPTAYSGAAIGSNVGRWFGLSKKWQYWLIGIGGGAGIAAIFKSPIGGTLFTLEVLHMPTTTVVTIALIIACLVASATAYVISGFTFDIPFDHIMAMDPHTLGWVALLGVCCGLYSIYYKFMQEKAEKLFFAIKNPWLAALATGGTLSICVFFFPGLFGEGFDTINPLVNGLDAHLKATVQVAGLHQYTLIVVIVAMLLLKGALVAASYSGGGIAGEFVPTFFAGALAGYLFALVANMCGSDLQPWYFALIGMGAVMAGTVHAPLMSIIILCETTNTYCYIFPYIIAVAISYAVVKILMPGSRGVGVDHDDLLALLKVKNDGNISAPSNVGNKTPSLIRKRTLRTKTADKSSPDQTPR